MTLDDAVEAEILHLLKPKVNLDAAINSDFKSYDAPSTAATPTTGQAKLMATAAADSPRNAPQSASATAAGSAQPPSTPQLPLDQVRATEAAAPVAPPARASL